MNDKSATTTGHGENAGSTRRNVATSQLAHVDPLEDAHPRVRPQRRVELAVPDVDRVDLRRAPLQEAVGEAARRGPGVQRPEPGNGHAESSRAPPRASARPATT